MEKTVFRQLLEFVPQRSFRRIVEKHEVTHGNQKVSAWEQFIYMSFAQLTHCNGLRDIQTSFRAMSHKAYHLGIQTNIARSNLSRANNSRPSVIFKSLAIFLIKEARRLYKDEKFENELNEVVYVLDSTYISLCLSLFPWGQIGKQNLAGVKIHTLLDLRGSIPSFIDISKGSSPDNKTLDQIIIEPGAFYVMDKAYVDFKRLNNIDEQKGFFVVRFKQNISFTRLSSNPSQQNKGVIVDQVGRLSGSVGQKHYFNKIRKVVFHDSDKNRTFTFMTNNFSIQPNVIAQLYKHRWKIEIFFKWTKQNLRIKKFYGTSQNAVETQIWIAISTYLLVAIAKKQLKLEPPLYQILHILSISLFEKELLFQLLNYNDRSTNSVATAKQLKLFD